MPVLPGKHCFLYFLVCFAWIPLQSLYSQTTRPQSDEVLIEKRLIEGKKYILLSDWDKAEAAYKAIIEKDVSNAPAYYELSRTLFATKRYTEALTNIRKAVKIDPQNEWYHLMEADILEGTGDVPGAMNVYEKLIALKPHQPHFYEVLIDYCRRFNDHERLIKVLTDFQKITGVTETTTRLKFETLDQLEREQEALAALEELVRVYPGIIDYKFLAASYARKAGFEDKAVALYREILKAEPNNSRAKLALAGSEKQAQDTVAYLQSIESVFANSAMNIDLKLEEILPYLLQFAKTRKPSHGEALLMLSDRIVDAHPKDAKAHALHGDVLSMLGKEDQAILAYQNAISLNGNVYLIWEQYLSQLTKQHQYELLLSEATKAVDFFPNQGYLYYAAGLGAFHSDKNSEALDWLNQALMMTGKNEAQKINVLNLMGLAYDKAGNIEKATHAFETSIMMNPKNIETKTYYALSLSRRILQSKKAIEMATDVLKDPTASGYILENVAEVFYNQKSYTEAEQAINKALSGTLSPAGYKLAGDIYEHLGQNTKAHTFWKMAIEAGLNDMELKKRLDQ